MRVILCDYLGNLKGHQLKVLKETASLLKSCHVETVICAPREYEAIFKKLGFPFIRLPYDVHFDSSSSGLQHIFKQIPAYLSMIGNIRKALSLEGILWITSGSYHLFLYLFFAFKTKCKLVLTLYSQKYMPPIHNSRLSRMYEYLYAQALQKVDYIVSTNNNFKFKNKTLYLKDYYYSGVYKRYLAAFPKKKKQIICVGTVAESKKDIRSTVIALQGLNIPLIIIGNFQNKEYYKEILKLNQNSQIRIENRYLSNQEYYQLMAESEFSLLPYYEELYTNQTSGVLQECVFLNTIPITHKEILKFNNICGVGYGNINDVSHIDFMNMNTTDYQNSFKKLIDEEFHKDIFIKRIKYMLNELPD